jgi:hypothetical protein
MNEFYIFGALIVAVLAFGWFAWPRKEKIAEEAKVEPTPEPAPAPAPPVPVENVTVAAEPVNPQITDAVTSAAPAKKPRAKKPAAPKATAARAKKVPAKKAKKK